MLYLLNVPQICSLKILVSLVYFTVPITLLISATQIPTRPIAVLLNVSINIMEIAAVVMAYALLHVLTVITSEITLLNYVCMYVLLQTLPWVLLIRLEIIQQVFVYHNVQVPISLKFR